MRNIKLTIQYDGTNFHGWQIQKSERTVQGEISAALKKIFKRKIVLVGSGRTDSGVHALGQVASFKVKSAMSCPELLRALNANISEDTAITAVKNVPLEFNAQFSAKRKTYCYSINNSAIRPCLDRNFVQHVPYKLNLHKMRQAIKFLKGRHDFRSFTATDSSSQNENTVRKITRLTIKKEGKLLKITIEANGFLYKMVRNIIGTLLDVGRGKLDPKKITTIIKARDRRLASKTAPAKGLCLMKVIY